MINAICQNDIPTHQIAFKQSIYITVSYDLVVRAFAYMAGGRGFEPYTRHDLALPVADPPAIKIKDYRLPSWQALGIKDIKRRRRNDHQ